MSQRRRHIGLMAIFVLAIIVPTAVLWFAEREIVLTFVGIASALFAGIAALGALFAVDEMRADRIERNQPFILTDFSIDSMGAIYFTIRNLGSGIARNVSIEFDPVPIDYKGRSLAELPILQEPIPMLTPSAEIRQLFHVGNRLFNEDVPRTFNVEVKYQGVGGMNHTQVFKLDLEQYRGVTLPPRTIEDYLGKLVDAVEKLGH